MSRPILRPLLLSTLIALGTTMTACAQTQPATGYAVPADGTLLSVSASADVKHAPDDAGVSAGRVGIPRSVSWNRTLRRGMSIRTAHSPAR